MCTGWHKGLIRRTSRFSCTNRILRTRRVISRSTRRTSSCCTPTPRKRRSNGAARHGQAQETSYRNADGETISWVLKHVVDVNSVLDADLSQDADLYSRHFRDYDAYQRFEPLLSGEQL
jgi:hypothetical protein